MNRSCSLSLRDLIEYIEGIEYPKFKYSEDYYFNILSLFYCKRKIIIPDALYNRTINENSATQQPFNDNKIDIIKSGEAVAEIIDTYDSSLTVFAIYYILENIVRLYYQVTILKHEKYDDIKLILVTKFNQLYDQWKRELHKELDNKIHGNMLKLFRASPKLCMTFLSVYYVIRVNMFKKFGII